MTVGGTTRVAAVIGSPVRHSLSPAIHNAAFAACGLDWVYVAFDVATGGAADALAAMRTFDLGGLSVTMPHKEAIAGAVDRLAPSAERLASVNCVVPTADGLVGHSTDGDGFVDDLRAGGVDPAVGPAVVLGAGGAARAIALALVASGAPEVTIVNRTAASAERAAAMSGARVGTVDDVRAASLVVNATSVGMGGTGEHPVDPSLLGAGQVVVDCVYHPVRTAWLEAAAARGATTRDGVGMLVHQAARAFTLWTGFEAPVEAMQTAARARLT